MESGRLGLESGGWEGELGRWGSRGLELGEWSRGDWGCSQGVGGVGVGGRDLRSGGWGRGDGGWVQGVVVGLKLP